MLLLYMEKIFKNIRHTDLHRTAHHFTVHGFSNADGYLYRLRLHYLSWCPVWANICAVELQPHNDTTDTITEHVSYLSKPNSVLVLVRVGEIV